MKLCVLDVRGVCEGCGRTLEEISAWPAASEAERAATVARSALRRQARGATGRAKG